MRMVKKIGEELVKHKTALNLLERNYPTDETAAITELSIPQINELRGHVMFQ